MAYFIGVDVGTGSARAGVFDASGDLKGTSSCAIQTFRPAEGMAQQSSAEIWGAVCQSVKAAVYAAGVASDDIAGIGFDATCSLVVTGMEGSPVSVDPENHNEQNVMLWMDHRAMADAEEINRIGGAVLQHVGGRISPEMELPKLRWLKRNLPSQWAKADQFWDLPDWLVHRATDSFARSLCSTVCKWTYLGHKGVNGEGWDDDFLRSIGLEDLSRENHRSIGSKLIAPGENVGGLSETAAQELGLNKDTPVAASLIDAYSGAIGTLGLNLENESLSSRLAVIAGTSTCHIAFAKKASFVPGVWGPYYGVAVPDMWALEGGQSAAGALIDAVIARHVSFSSLQNAAAAQQKRITDLLDERLRYMAEESAFLSSDRHVQPDFHGNRSPLADPWRKGAIVGLGLHTDENDLAIEYLATIQALAYGTRHILDEMKANGVVINTLVMSGGLARNELYVREHADATGCDVLVPEQDEPVLLGSAILGAVASGKYKTLPEAMRAMSGSGTIVKPRAGSISSYHKNKYKVFRLMQDHYRQYNAVMHEEEN